MWWSRFNNRTEIKEMNLNKTKKTNNILNANAYGSDKVIQPKHIDSETLKMFGHEENIP